MGASTGAVFLSYASEDSEAAQRIAEALKLAGIEVWFDKSELRGGDVWDQSIRKQIKSCALFIPVISRNTDARAEGYFRLEWKLAVDRSHLMTTTKAFLLPVAIDDTPDEDEQVPERFRELQWTRLPRGEPSPAFVTRVAGLLRDATPMAPAGGGGIVSANIVQSRRVVRPKTWAAAGAAAVAVVLVAGWLAWRHLGPHAPSASCTRQRVGPGDIVIIPPHTAHGFAEIETPNIVYTVMRVDPHRVLELHPASP